MGNNVAWNARAHPLTRPPKTSWQDYTAMARNPFGVNSPRTAGSLGNIIGGTIGAGIGRVLGNIADNKANPTIERGYLRTAENQTVSQPWGAVFHYNPTDIQMATATSDNLVAGTMGSDHTAIPLGSYGLSTVAFSLYFNRIFDLNAARSDYPIQLGKDPLGYDHYEMIQRLGTQWDVEFLLRAVNVNPMNDQLLGYKTADFGALAGRPVDVHLGALSWRGTISTLSINHVMFTPEFVPTFTKVDIALTRIMTLGLDDSANATNTDTTSSSSTTSGSTSTSKTTTVTKAADSAAVKMVQSKRSPNINVAKKQLAAANPQTGAAAAAR